MGWVAIPTQALPKRERTHLPRARHEKAAKTDQSRPQAGRCLDRCHTAKRNQRLRRSIGAARCVSDHGQSRLRVSPRPRATARGPLENAVARSSAAINTKKICYFTITLMTCDMTGGTWGTCDQSPNTNCSVCVPGGSVTIASVCPPPKCRCWLSEGIGAFN
jgi:hypothetical protein